MVVCELITIYYSIIIIVILIYIYSVGIYCPIVIDIYVMCKVQKNDEKMICVYIYIGEY